MQPAILLFGATSILGFHLARMFPNMILPFISPGHTAPAVSQWAVLRLEDPRWIETCVARHDPNLVIYSHAICDLATCAADPDWAHE